MNKKLKLIITTILGLLFLKSIYNITIYNLTDKMYEQSDIYIITQLNKNPILYYIKEFKDYILTIVYFLLIFILNQPNKKGE